MPRRLLPLFLSGLVAWASLATIARGEVGRPASEVGKAGAEHPALHQISRPELRLGRPGGPRGLDPGPAFLPLALTAPVPALAPPAAGRAHASKLEAVRAGQPVSINRSSRGPPGQRT